jgi:hypothetical protein
MVIGTAELRPMRSLKYVLRGFNPKIAGSTEDSRLRTQIYR